MTSVEHIPNAPVPTRIGQGTAIEQSRAVAEVHAAIVVAQQCPRDIQVAIADMRTACSRRALAERAFYQFPRAGQTVSGESVYLARELARCWGNIQYGIAELRRDDEAGQSEMQGVRLCRRCPLRTPCADWGAGTGQDGMWGGLWGVELAAWRRRGT